MVPLDERSCDPLQTYGKGTARACRMHVQKLNMARGTRERSEGGTSHPPCDYANTFTAQEDDKKDPRDNLVKKEVMYTFFMYTPTPAPLAPLVFTSPDEPPRGTG